MRVVRSGKTPYVRFDRNLYSIPHTHVRKAADPARLSHPRPHPRRSRPSWPAIPAATTPHRPSRTPRISKALLAATRQANVHTTRDRLRAAVPATVTPSSSASPNAETPCDRTPPGCSPCSTITDREELATAVALALERDALGAGSITHILETRRRQRGLKPPLRLTLPDRPGLRDLDVRSS